MVDYVIEICLSCTWHFAANRNIHSFIFCLGTLLLELIEQYICIYIESYEVISFPQAFRSTSLLNNVGCFNTLCILEWC